MKIGIDYGTSYVKLLGVYTDKNAVFIQLPSKPLNRAALKFYLRKIPLKGEHIESIYITGSKTKFLPSDYESIPVHTINEWDALYRGAKYLHPKKDFILINCGSGTSIHLITENVSKHIGGTALGGKTIDAFTHVLKVNKVPILHSFSKLHSTVSELVPDLQDLSGSLPGVYFAKMTGRSKKPDIVAALEQMVVDEILTITSILGKATLNNQVVLTGGALMKPNVYSRFQYWIHTGVISQLEHDWDRYISCIGLIGVPKSIIHL